MRDDALLGSAILLAHDCHCTLTHSVQCQFFQRALAAEQCIKMKMNKAKKKKSITQK